MRWRYTWRVGVSSAADSTASMGVVAGMHPHVLLFAHAHAHPCFGACAHCHLSTPVPTIIDSACTGSVATVVTDVF